MSRGFKKKYFFPEIKKVLDKVAEVWYNNIKNRGKRKESSND